MEIMMMRATTKQQPVFILLLLYGHILLKCFTYINRFNPPQNCEVATIIILIYRLRN